MGTYGNKNGIVIWRDTAGVARIATLKAGEIQAALIADGVTWAGGNGVLNSDGIEFSYGGVYAFSFDDAGFVIANAMKGVELGVPTASKLCRIWSVGDGTEVGCEISTVPDETCRFVYGLDVITLSGKLMGFSIPACGIRVTATSDTAPATGIELNVTGDDATALKVVAGKINCGGIIVQSVGDATAATDALNRQTGDGRYSTKHILAVATKTADYTAGVNDDVIVCNKATSMTITLPAATGTGRVYTIKSIGAGAVTVDGNASETIDGATTQTLGQWDALKIIDYGTGTWAII